MVWKCVSIYLFAFDHFREIAFQVTPDGSVHDIESEEEIRAVEAVLRDHEAHDSDEYSEPDTEKLPMDRCSLLIQLQVCIPMCSLLCDLHG